VKLADIERASDLAARRVGLKDELKRAEGKRGASLVAILPVGGGRVELSRAAWCDLLSAELTRVESELHKIGIELW
jgi:hypothetical protein